MTLVPDKYLSGKLFTNKNNQMQYSLNDRDGESYRDSYSRAPIITERSRKSPAPRQPIYFGFGIKNYYTINTATPNFPENPKNNITEENVNKILEKMENRFYRMSDNLQRKRETQLNAAIKQTQQTIIEFNTQHNQSNGNNNYQHRDTHTTEFRPQRFETKNNDSQNNSITEPP